MAAAGPWIPDGELRTAVQSIVNVPIDGNLLPSFPWDTIITNANRLAALDIISVFTGKGFTYAQISGCDFIADLNKYQGIYHALQEGAAITGIAADRYETYNRVEMMAKMDTILIGGIATAPNIAGTDVGGITHGTSTAGACSAARQFAAFSSGNCNYCGSTGRCGCNRSW